MNGLPLTILERQISLHYRCGILECTEILKCDFRPVTPLIHPAVLPFSMQPLAKTQTLMVVVLFVCSCIGMAPASVEQARPAMPSIPEAQLGSPVNELVYLGNQRNLLVEKLCLKDVTLAKLKGVYDASRKANAEALMAHQQMRELRAKRNEALQAFGQASIRKDGEATAAANDQITALGNQIEKLRATDPVLSPLQRALRESFDAFRKAEEAALVQSGQEGKRIVERMNELRNLAKAPPASAPAGSDTKDENQAPRMIEGGQAKPQLEPEGNGPRPDRASDSKN